MKSYRYRCKPLLHLVSGLLFRSESVRSIAKGSPKNKVGVCWIYLAKTIFLQHFTLNINNIKYDLGVECERQALKTDSFSCQKIYDPHSSNSKYSNVDATYNVGADI